MRNTRSSSRLVTGGDINSSPPVSREQAQAPGAAAGDQRIARFASIAVLPFADMSPSHDQEYLCEGLAEELINALTQVDGLRVAARTASFQFRGKGEDVQIVGKQLNVEALLEGSVRKSDDRLRVTVQLIEVASGYHRWSHRFDGQFEDVFAMQDEIAESVATSLRCGRRRVRGEKRPPHRAHTGTEAYELYLRGRQHLPADPAWRSDCGGRAVPPGHRARPGIWSGPRRPRDGACDAVRVVRRQGRGPRRSGARQSTRARAGAGSRGGPRRARVRARP